MLRRKLPLKFGLMIAGLVYFEVFSYWEMPPLVKSYSMLLPVQLGALAYFAYLYWYRKEPKT
jgi:hypothetical protein